MNSSECGCHEEKNDLRDRVTAVEGLVADLQRHKSLVLEEITGLRQMVEGLKHSMDGAFHAYKAAAQRNELLEKAVDSR